MYIAEFKKKILAGALTAGMVLSLAACGTSGNQNDQNDTATEDNGAVSGNENSGNDTAGAVTEESGVTVDHTVSVDTIHSAVREAYGESYLPSVLLSEDEIQAVYGIEPEWCEEIIAEVSMISVQVDTFIGVKASEGHIADVTDAVIAYQDYLKNDTLQYPSNLSKIAASTVVTMDQYVFFIMLGDVDMAVMDEEESVQIEAFMEQNQIAVDAIEKVLLK